MENTTLNATIEKDIFKKTTNTLASQILDMGILQSRAVVNELDLYDFQKPGLNSGEYTVTVEQTVKVDSYTDPEVYKSELKLKVDKPKSALAPTDVFQTYPPKGAFGKYATFLPHLVLNQSSFPWEYPHFSTTKNVPWLALVLMDEDENADLVTPGQKVKVPKEMMPQTSDLAYLAHVSKRNKPQAGAKNISPEAKMEKAVLIANRFPTPGKTNTVYLIALDKTAVNDEYTCLFSWNFICEEEGKDGLKHILENINMGPFRLPDFKPSNATPAAESIIEKRKNMQSQGFVPLPHHNRVGLKMMSWYRGPLVPDTDFAEAQDQTLMSISAINSSDQLLRFSKTTKKLDVTYAAAWELGKWLTLQNKEVSIELYKWKKAVATALKLKKQHTASGDDTLTTYQTVQQQIATMFTGKGSNIQIPEMTKPINDWLQELLFLRPLPFNYLVPDARLLPDESIRFFTLDEGWLWALIDGALSIGRNPTERKAPPFGAPKLHLSGFLMRSDAISQFPDLKLEAPNFELLEKRTLGNDIWLCIFRSNTAAHQYLDKVELFLPQAGMRFGGEIVSGEIKKELTDNSQTIAIPLEGKNVVNIPSLYQQLLTAQEKSKPASELSKSSLFAFNMIQLAPKVIFDKNKNTE